MKPNTSFKILTLAGLLFYTGQLLAGDNIIDPQAQTDAHQRQCMSGLASATHLNFPALDAGKNPDYSADVFKTAETNNPAAYKRFTACINGDTVTNNDPNANPKCDNAEKDIDKDLERLENDCKNAPKASEDDDAAADSGAPTTATAKLNVSTWGVCLQDAKTCDPAGENDSAETCAAKTLDDIAKDGGDVATKLVTFCRERYPKQCGALNKTDLKATAKDLDSSLTTELGELKTEIANKKQDIQTNQDNITKINKAVQDQTAQFSKEIKALQANYEADMENQGKQIDADLVNFYKVIANDQQAIKIASAAVTNADAVKFDAQNKFVNACKAEAKKEADQKFPSGNVNYGGQNALVTRKSRWADYYSEILQSLYGDGTTCDNGNYANAQLALLNAQKAQVESEAQLQTDQTQLRTAMTQNQTKKSDANYKGIVDQTNKVNDLAIDQKKRFTDIMSDKQKAIQKDKSLHDELTALEAKSTAGAKKRQCIQTIRSCADVPGIPSGSGNAKDVADLEDAPKALRRVIGDCQRAAKYCNDDKDKDNKTQIADSTAAFTAYLNSLDGVKTTNLKIPADDLPFDTNGKASVCEDAIAGDLEMKGPLRGSKKKSTSDHK